MLGVRTACTQRVVPYATAGVRREESNPALVRTHTHVPTGDARKHNRVGALTLQLGLNVTSTRGLLLPAFLVFLYSTPVRSFRSDLSARWNNAIEGFRGLAGRRRRSRRRRLRRRLAEHASVGPRDCQLREKR